MKMDDGKRLVAIAVVGAGLLLMGPAGAWYGNPATRPYASGAVTYSRQNTMRSHRYAMDRLAPMLEGQQIFNRDEAVRLARDLEAGFGDKLIKDFPPGTLVAGSRTLPATWRHFDSFRQHAKDAEQAAARLAEALEESPTGQDFPQKGMRVPPWGRRMGYGPGPRGPQQGSVASAEVMQAYGELGAICHSCHNLFRGGRR